MTAPSSRPEDCHEISLSARERSVRDSSVGVGSGKRSTGCVLSPKSIGSTTARALSSLKRSWLSARCALTASARVPSFVASFIDRDESTSSGTRVRTRDTARSSTAGSSTIPITHTAATARSVVSAARLAPESRFVPRLPAATATASATPIPTSSQGARVVVATRRQSLYAPAPASGAKMRTRRSESPFMVVSGGA